MSEVIDRRKIYIDGAWADSDGAGHIDVTNPATEQVVGRVADSTSSDVDRAVEAATAAFPKWAALSGAERGGYLKAIHENLAARMPELVALTTSELGMPAAQVARIQIGMPVANVAAYAELASSYNFDAEEIGNSLVVHEPIGVVGANTPWNYPLHQVVLKVAAALAAGCTVVLKPAAEVPLISFAFADAVHAAGLPAGVFNIVSGRGSVIGEAMTAHPDVNLISFTGSTAVGGHIASEAGKQIKPVSLELGGKSACIVLDDANLQEAITGTVTRCMLNTGQTCIALTRLLVPHDLLPQATAIAVAVSEHFTHGDPLEEASKMDPLVSAAQRKAVEEYIQVGIDEGATLALDGRITAPGTGHYVGATVFTDVTENMRIAQEEIFGPVLSIIGYSDEDEAVRIANNSEYGLSGAVWSGSDERAMSVARRVRTGQIQINDGAFNLQAPFGGYKKSGIGREAGRHGLEEFLEIKAIQR